MAVLGAGHTGRRNCDCVERGGQGELDAPHSLSTERQPPRTLPPPFRLWQISPPGRWPFGVQSNFGERVGRHMACPYLITADGLAARRGWATGGIDSRPATRRQRGMVSGGRCGGNPPAQGRAEGPTAELQWSVVSGEGAFAERGRELALGWSLQRCRKVHPQSGMRPHFFCDCSHETPMLQWPDAEKNNLILLTFCSRDCLGINH